MTDVMEEVMAVKPKNPRGGRRPKSPSKKLQDYLRFTCTTGMKDLVDKVADDLGINESDVLRLALYQYLERNGYMAAESMRAEPTWETLIARAMVPMPDLAKLRLEREAKKDEPKEE